MNPITDVIDDFLKALELAGITMDKASIKVIDLGYSHQPKCLPSGKMGIYTFLKGDRFLKIGKVGPKSNARFRSQHYCPYRSKSNLATSILNDNKMLKYDLDDSTIEDWIKKHTRRIDILLDESVDVLILSFLEAFLHCRFNPAYEGHQSQRNFQID